MEKNSKRFDQCEQIADCTENTGDCEKAALAAKLTDKLTGALIGLARAALADPFLATPDTWKVMVEGLFATITNVNFDEHAVEKLIERVHAAKTALAPMCASCGAPCGRNDDYDMTLLWNAGEDIRSAKSLLLFGIRGIASYACHAMVLGYMDDELNQFLARALFTIGEDWYLEELLSVAMEMEQYNLHCMELLDRANAGTSKGPVPAQGSAKEEKDPSLAGSKHDLLNLKSLLAQAEGKSHGSVCQEQNHSLFLSPNVRSYLMEHL